MLWLIPPFSLSSISGRIRVNQSFLLYDNGEKRGEGERLSKRATFVGPNWSSSFGVEMAKLCFNGDC